MCVISHVYGGLVGGWDGGGDGMHVGRSQGVGSMPGDVEVLPECEVVIH